MMPETINPDTSPVLIEAVYYQHFWVYRNEFDSIEEARSFLKNGEDYGTLASVGVFVDGEPRVLRYGRPYKWADADLDEMRADYAKAQCE